MTELRTTIQSLQPGMSPDQLESWKRQALSLIDSATGSAGELLHDRLSPRETEVFDMLLAGKRLKEIAADLDISVKTVTTHRSRLMRKLNVEDNLGLYRYGIRNGLIGV
ncbi:MAG TPA: LuxR C-terminal-related transcriptional regulator [Thermoanaerobaculia bacterium]|nr:LuxR C-terminal-related transcriptional regulator [Thermoanaerobaculia bacterium]